MQYNANDKSIIAGNKTKVHLQATHDANKSFLNLKKNHSQKYLIDFQLAC